MKKFVSWYGVVVASKTRVRCLFCGVHVPKSAACIEQHVEGANHKQNLETTEETGVIFIEPTLHCRLCKRNLPADDCAWTHVAIREHSDAVIAMEDLTEKQYISVKSYMSGESDDAYCEVCQENFTFSMRGLECHVFNINHRRNLIEHIKPLNGIFSALNNKLWCKACNVYINNNVRAILKHIDIDLMHMHWFMELEGAIYKQGVSIKAFLENELETRAHCEKCNIYMLCNKQHILAHVISVGHFNEMQE